MCCGRDDDMTTDDGVLCSRLRPKRMSGYVSSRDAVRSQCAAPTPPSVVCCTLAVNCARRPGWTWCGTVKRYVLALDG